jgi:hypothetical protein
VTEDERDILLARYFDGSATAEQIEALDRAAVADPMVARALFAAADQELALRDTLASAPSEIKPINADPVTLPLIETEAPSPLRGWWTARTRLWTSIAACLLLAAGIAFWATRPSTTPIAAAPKVTAKPAQPLAMLTTTGPGLSISRGGVTQPGGSDTVISTKDTLSTGFDPASFVYAQEQTTVTVAGQTRVAFAGDALNKQLDVLDGSINCEVQKQQAGHPFIVMTPQARVEVRGTRFDVTTRGQWTRVDVSHGTVRVTRLSDGATVDVSAREYVYCSKTTATLPSVVPGGFPAARGRDMGEFWSTKVGPAGISK